MYPHQVNINQLLASYYPQYQQESHRIKQDISDVLRFRNNLMPKRGTLMLNTGQECSLLVLDGTIEISHRGQNYNTPIEVYITESYPNSPPVAYVRPKAGLTLKSGHRHVDNNGMIYLPYLHEWRRGTHNLVHLCAHMSSVFGAEPPLFASPKPSPAAASPPVYSYGGVGVVGTPHVASHGSQAQIGGTYPQAYPVKPHQPQATPAASPIPSASPRPSPALPPRPKDIRDAKEKEVTAKLQSDLHEVYTKLRGEIDTEMEAQTKLNLSQEQVKADLQDLTSQRDELAALIQICTDKRDEMDNYLDEKKASEAEQGKIDASDLIEPADRLSQQMITLVSENQAIEDCMYQLERAVTDGVIPAEDFLREIRRLSRKQFVARATMKKVEQAQANRRRASDRAPPPVPAPRTSVYHCNPNPAPGMGMGHNLPQGGGAGGGATTGWGSSGGYALPSNVVGGAGPALGPASQYGVQPSGSAVVGQGGGHKGQLGEGGRKLTLNLPLTATLGLMLTQSLGP
ncbi:unnamed protein product [Discosporangium mesarthrocarpum]